MSEFEKFEKWYNHLPSIPSSYTPKGIALAAWEEQQKTIDKLNKVVEAYESMEFNVRELLSAVSESHKADALFELRNDCKALAELNNKG